MRHAVVAVSRHLGAFGGGRGEAVRMAVAGGGEMHTQVIRLEGRSRSGTAAEAERL